MSRIERLKEQNPVLAKSIIDLLSEVDPSDNNKYLEFIIKCVKNDLIYGGKSIEKNILGLFFSDDEQELIKKFNNHLVANRITKNDITQYSNLNEIKIEVKKADEILEQKALEKQTKILVNNDEYLVLIPLSYGAASKYGANTKWCITEYIHWSKYIPNCKLLFIIDKSNNTKFAMCFDYSSEELTLWNSVDDKISLLNNDIPFDILMKCMSEIRDCNQPISKMDGFINSGISRDEYPKKDFYGGYLNTLLYDSTYGRNGYDLEYYLNSNSHFIH